jgi:SAM-dependent methyltransferase
VNCIGCTSENLTYEHGTIAPFVVTRAVMADANTKTAVCGDCGLRYATRRLTDEENTRLYADYRGEGYTAMRNAMEPGYAAHNEVLQQPRDYMRQVEAFIQTVAAAPTRVLDIGGGNGQNTPFADTATVTITDLATGEDYRAITSRKRYDLIVMAHVLEHVAAPRDALDFARSKLAKGGVIYAEVPDEPAINYWHEHQTKYSERSLRAMFGELLAYQRIVTTLGPVFMVVAR